MLALRLILLMALTVGSAALGVAGSRQGTDLPPGTVPLRGAGSTFAAPLYKTWLDAYQKRHPEVALSYDAIGSGEGTQQFLAGTVDFGASDAAMSDEEMAEVTRGVQLVPALAGSIVLAYNLEGLGGHSSSPGRSMSIFSWEKSPHGTIRASNRPTPI